jgi:tight adherence protein C
MVPPMFSSISQMLTDTLGPLGPVLILLLLGVILILLALPTMMKKRPDAFAKIKMQRSEKVSAAKDGQALRRGEKGDKLDRFAHFLEPQNQEEMSASRMRMMRAGYNAKNSVRMFHAAQFILGISALVIGLLLAMVKSATGDVTAQQMVLYTIVPGALGYYLPKYWITKRIAARQTQIVQGFPDALDMMLVCVEAGQSLDQSILRVAKESRAGYPALADEFDTVANEVKAGKERKEVLRDMSDRCGIPDVASFVTTLIQSATFGTSIAEALRVYSAEMRDKRVMRAEEKANVLPTKLTLGTMLFTLPPLLIILIGPSVYGISQLIGS